MNIILSLQFYLLSSSSATPWPGALPLQLQGPNYGNGDTNTFSKRMFEQFTEYLTHSLTAALDQLRVVASSTSNDPGPRSRQHQQI